MSSDTDQLQAKRIELILQQLEQLPTLPAVAMRILDVTSDAHSSAAHVVSLISSDVSLTARILQLVHRADAGVRGEVNTVERAVVLLGFEAVRSAVLAVSVFQTFAGAPQKSSNFSRDEFWKHSLAVGCCAELLAEPLRMSPSEAFVCGLLHDMGKIALDAVLPKSFSRVVEATDLLRGNIADLERTVIGLDHMVVGKRLAERWNLPQSMRECIWLHGQLPELLPATVKFPRLVNLITLADIIVRQQHLGYSGNYGFPAAREKIMDAVGISQSAVDTALQTLVERIETRATALDLGHASTRELYQQAIVRANQELGRVSNELAVRNKKLSVRAKFFDALATFHGELRPDAAPTAVLRAIGQTAVGVLGVASVAAFSLLPSQNFAETLLFDDAGEVFETSLVDCLKRPEFRANGDGPVLRAGEELDWMLAAISPRLAGDQRYWICLEADGMCIGGVVWGAAAGEAQRLGPQVRELAAMSVGWALALRTSQIREEYKSQSEQLSEVNRKLQETQSELVRSRMMSGVGEMAAGAAHEMNNPLAVISGRSQLLAAQLTDPRHKAMAHLLCEQTARLSDIISELMDFAKPAAAEVASCDPAELIDRALHEAKLKNDPADRTIEVTIQDVPFVNVDSTQVTAALTEVIDNAILATDPKNGQVNIHAGFDAFSSRVVITVADNGSGMNETTLKRAFDPFFSSKPAGRRRGMGLAKALRWIESSGGTMKLESRPGEGTRMLLLLPSSAARNDVRQDVRKAASDA